MVMVRQDKVPSCLCHLHVAPPLQSVALFSILDLFWCPGPAQDWLQFILRPGGGAGQSGAEEGAAGVRTLEQDRGLLPRLQRTGRPHPGGY